MSFCSRNVIPIYYHLQYCWQSQNDDGRRVSVCDCDVACMRACVCEYTMDLVHYGKGIPSPMHCGYFVLVKMLLCRHYPMLKDLCFSGVSQDLAISQTGYLTRKCSEKDFRAYIQSV